MPNLYCTIADNDFASYGIIQEVIAVCSCHTVKEKERPLQIVIQISFLTVKDKLLFLQQMHERLPAVVWKEKP